MSQEIDEIKSKIDIAELIGEYVKLIPAGANYRALCPFHNEKTPSFMVNPAKQIFKCFGCGEGGDAFSFLMKAEGLEFPEALKILAQKAGVVLSRSTPQIDSQKNRLTELTDLTARYWHKILLESSVAVETREYLKQRGISDESVEDFRVGLAIDSWDDLFNFLRKRGFSENEIFLAGLSVKKDRGAGFYDRFRGRLMFPIIDLHGRVVGFGGRALKSDERAKYINTPQTEIYNKSLIVYGLFQAKDAIKKNDLCVLVEGYMDVIPSHQAGVKNVAAISGTALSLEQVKMLKRYSNNLSLALDMDLAGRQAAERSIDLALQEEMNVKVINLPFGKDPGECIKNNPADWPLAIENAQSAMEYFWARATADHDLAKPENKKAVVKIMLDKILKLGSPVEQDYWLKETGQRLSVSENVLRELIMSSKSKVFRPRAGEAPAPITKMAVPSRESAIFAKILALVLAFPEHLEEVAEKLETDFIEENLCLGLYKSLILFYTKNTDLFNKLAVDKSDDFDLFENLKRHFEENGLGREVFDFLTNSFFLSEKEFSFLESREAKTEIGSLIKTLKFDFLNKKINLLQNELTKAEKESAQEKVVEIYSQLNELVKQRRFI